MRKRGSGRAWKNLSSADIDAQIFPEAALGSANFYAHYRHLIHYMFFRYGLPACIFPTRQVSHRGVNNCIKRALQSQKAAHELWGLPPLRRIGVQEVGETLKVFTNLEQEDDEDEEVA
jgi:hypothetical protein